MSIEHLKQFEDSKTILEWSEFHYHLFSHLISDDCPRALAQNIELACFPESWVPNTDFLAQCVEACVLSEDEQDLNQRLQQLIDLAKASYPTFRWKETA
jgi:hypothetical protein